MFSISKLYVLCYFPIFLYIYAFVRLINSLPPIYSFVHSFCCWVRSSNCENRTTISISKIKKIIKPMLLFADDIRINHTSKPIFLCQILINKTIPWTKNLTPTWGDWKGHSYSKSSYTHYSPLCIKTNIRTRSRRYFNSWQSNSTTAFVYHILYLYFRIKKG